MSDTTRAPLIGEIIWHRPEYYGRQDELINATDIARLAGASRSTVDNWRTKYRDTFPPVVMAVTVTAANAAYYYAPAEVAQWLLEHRPGPKRAAEAQRLAVAVDDLYFEIEEAETRVRHLRALRQQIAAALTGAAVP